MLKSSIKYENTSDSLNLKVQNISNLNCADKIRASQDLLILQCQENGNLLILNR